MSISPELRDLISRPKNIVVVTHYRPDADALGSSLGLAGSLTQLGHQVKVITPGEFPAFLSWMPGAEQVLCVVRDNPRTQREAESYIIGADIIFCLDFNGLGRIDSLGEPVGKAAAVKVMIDHHLEPEDFAEQRIWDVSAASTAQLIWGLIKDLNDDRLLTAGTANCLYAGLMTDTGGFRHNNTHQSEFSIAAELVACGAEPHVVARKVYDSNSLNRLRLQGHVLCNKLVVLEDYRAAYVSLTREEFQRFESQTGDTEGLVNLGLSVKGVRLSAFFQEREGEIRISLRSFGNFSVNEMARRHFNGGGHFNAAGGSAREPLDAVVARFVALLGEYQNELRNED